MMKSLEPATIAFPTPIWCVGSYDSEEKPNVMTIAWGGICCSVPPCLTVSLRKATYTYGCIMEHKAYTVSIPSVKYLAEADYFGMASGKNVDKFAATGLTPVRSELVDAPYVGEFPVVFECRLIHTLEIGLHTQFVGEIVGIKADENVMGENGLPDMNKVETFTYDSTSKNYLAIGSPVEKGFNPGKRFMK
ncbi:flavin reductase family protein [Maridesulfovibrio sp.]|uniref:flavin reductase family protein n=1 Tax=Maridesulfovibrio sp. TaxID=2795000 RepID=UPI002A1882C9|nr:flavin reductase family protein [Maridesulfovibrio sp.]